MNYLFLQIHIRVFFNTIVCFFNIEMQYIVILLNFSMMSKNRRFPFERSKETILLDNFSTSEQQLYPIIRQYASISRLNDHPRSRPVQQPIVSYEENDRLDRLINHLKEQAPPPVNTNEISSLRQDHIQHWKHVKSQWQEYYREENRKQQEIFDRLIQTLR